MAIGAPDYFLEINKQQAEERLNRYRDSFEKMKQQYSSYNPVEHGEMFCVRYQYYDEFQESIFDNFDDLIKSIGDNHEYSVYLKKINFLYSEDEEEYNKILSGVFV